MASQEGPSASKADPFAPTPYLVLPQNRREVPRREQEGVHDIESLHGKINPNEMGERAFREQLPIANAPTKDINTSVTRTRVAPTKKSGNRKMDIHTLLKSNLFTGLTYKPKSTSSFAVYELLLNYISSHFLTDVSDETLHSAADEILVVLKNAILRDLDKKVKIEELLGVKEISEDQFSQLSGLAKRLLDYTENMGSVLADHDHQPQDSIQKFKEMDGGIMVVFDDDEGEDGTYTFEEEEEEEEENMKEEYQPAIVQFGEQIAASEGGTQHDQYWLDVRDVDAFWIQRQLSEYYEESQESHNMAKSVFDILKQSVAMEQDGQSTKEDIFRYLENHLGLLLDFDKFHLIKLFMLNRKKIVFSIELAQVKSDESQYQRLLQEIGTDKEGREIIESLRQPSNMDSLQWKDKLQVLRPVTSDSNMEDSEDSSNLQEIDIESLGFEQGSHVMTNKKVDLPPSSWKKSHVDYEEIHVPAPKMPPLQENEHLVSVIDLPTWVHPAFEGMKTLNRIQSRVCNTALSTDENMLVCAPTGAGKTNVALLAIMRLFGQYGLFQNQELDFESFKIVYIAPMKALVQEMVASFTKRLASYQIKVAELSGDVQMNRQQLQDTQMIVTTPEKWDVVTRKHYGDMDTIRRQIKLVIIDEIHLLHDERGPVVEALVARMMRSLGGHEGTLRFLGLSATLPNYEDVSRFLHVNTTRGLFYFDSRYRPCPLSQTYYGILEKKPLKRLAIMNELAYNKTMECISKKNQMLIFVHSRKETFKTGQYLRDISIQRETIHRFILDTSADANILALLEDVSQKVENKELGGLLSYGIGLHHAGLSRNDRQVVEELFSSGALSVLVSTATLAWGVNLPAHTVLIKGTDVYSPEKGKWTELSSQDILQMFGRAGRPQYDDHGEGILLTTSSHLHYYLSVCQQQLPIESQLLQESRLVDLLNAEIVLGHVRNLEDALHWFSFTYLAIRMQQAPSLYPLLKSGNKSSLEIPMDDEQCRSQVKLLLHSVCLVLDRSGLVHYENRTGRLTMTELGRITSYYYLRPATLSIFSKSLHSGSSLIDLFRVFSMSDEFKRIMVRSEEKAELARLIDVVPVPIKEDSDDPLAKINVLLQTWLSGLPCKGFALMTDLVYITQSAGRLMKALFELALLKGWPSLIKRCHEICLVLLRKTWQSSHPLRQFRNLSWQVVSSTGLSLLDKSEPISTFLTPSILHRLEKKELPLDRLVDLDDTELGQLYKLTNLQAAKNLHRLIHAIPLIRVQVSMQPKDATHFQVALNVSLQETFQWDPFLHGNSLSFMVLLEDQEEEKLHYYDWIILSPTKDSIDRNFTVSLPTPFSPVYMVRVFSEQFLHSNQSVPVKFHLDFKAPQDHLMVHPVLDLTPLYLTSELNKAAARIVPGDDDEITWEFYESVVTMLSSVGLTKPFHFFHNSQVGKLTPLQTQCWRLLYTDTKKLGNDINGPENVVTFPSLSILTTPYCSGVEELYLAKIIFDKSFHGVIISPDIIFIEKLSQVFMEFSVNYVYLNGNDIVADLAILNSLAVHGSPESGRIVIFSTVTFEKLTRKPTFFSWYSKQSPYWTFALFNLDLWDMYLEAAFFRFKLRSRCSTATSNILFAWKRTLLFGRPLLTISSLVEWLNPQDDGTIKNSNITPNHNPSNSFHVNQYTESGIPALDASITIHPLPFHSAYEMERHLFPVLYEILLHHSTSPTNASYPNEAKFKIPYRLGIVFSTYWIRQEFIDYVQFQDKIFEFTPSCFILLTKEQCATSAYCDTLILTSPFTEDNQIDSTNQLIRWHSKALIDCSLYVPTRLVPYFIDIFPSAITSSSTRRSYTNTLVQNSRSFSASIESTLNASFSSLSFLPALALSPLLAEFFDKPEVMISTLTYSYFYLRLMKNPHYYGLQDVKDPLLISEILSTLIENSIHSLSSTHMIEPKRTEYTMQDTEIIPDISYESTEHGLIAAHYSIAEETIRMFVLSVKPTTKSKGILELIASAIEFDKVPVRSHEVPILFTYYQHELPYSLATLTVTAPHHVNEPHVKAYILLQWAFSRSATTRQGTDISVVDQEIYNLWLQDYHTFIEPWLFSLFACLMDCSASLGYLTPALYCIDWLQAIHVGAHPALSSRLIKDTEGNRVLPRFMKVLPNSIQSFFQNSSSIEVDSCQSIYDVVESPILSSIFSSAPLIHDWSVFLKSFPSIDVELAYSLISQDFSHSLFLDFERDEAPNISCALGDSIKLNCTLKRPYSADAFLHEADSDGYIYLGTPHVSEFSTNDKRRENWWILLGHTSTKTLLAIKRIPLASVWKLTKTPAKQPFCDSSNEDSTTYLYFSIDLEIDLDPESPLVLYKNQHAHPSSLFQDQLTFYLVTDSWVGIDQEYPISLSYTN